MEKEDKSDIFKCWRKRKEFEVCGRLDENFKIVVCKGKQPLSKERGIPRRGWSACTAGCLLGGSIRSSSRLAEKTPWDAPPVPSSVEECPAHSDVRGSAAPRGQIRGSRPGRVSASKREVIG